MSELLCTYACEGMGVLPNHAHHHRIMAAAAEHGFQDYSPHHPLLHYPAFIDTQSCQGLASMADV